MLMIAIDGQERSFGIDIIATNRIEQQQIFYCFPYYLPRGSFPPYPGFDCLEIWLTQHLNNPNVNWRTTTWNQLNTENFMLSPRSTMCGPWSAMEVTFDDPEEAMLFRLLCS